MIVRVNVVLNRTVVVDSDGRFDNLCGSHFQSQVNSYRHRKNDGIKQNELRENDWTTDIWLTINDCLTVTIDGSKRTNDIKSLHSQ